MTSGTTWHSAAMMNCISGSPHFNQLVKYTRDLVSSGILEEETGTVYIFKDSKLLAPVALLNWFMGRLDRVTCTVY